MPWWLLVILTSLVGWLLVNGTVTFYYQYLRDLYESYSDPPPELALQLTSDGAKRVFALLFGWLYGLIYLTPFACIYGLLGLFKRENAAEQDAAANP